MRSKLAFLTFLTFLFLAYVGIKFFILDKQAVYGRLKVNSTPPVSVFIDSLAVGKTPYEDKIKEGEYLLKLIPQGEATNTASWQGKIKIFKNALTYVNRELGSSDITSAGEIFTISKMDTRPKNSNYGEIFVETEPIGAIVYLDNEEKGVAPLILADVLKGQHEISVFMPGFLRRTQKLNVTSGYRINAVIKLAIDENQKPLPKDEATKSAKIKKTFIRIKETPLGFLRVRESPSVSASESARISPGDRFELVDEEGNWYKIKYEQGKEGWIFSEYAEKEASDSAE